MRTFHIKHLPVINERGTVIGIVTDRDVKTASPSIFAQNRSNEDLKKPVELIMSKEVITIGIYRYAHYVCLALALTVAAFAQTSRELSGFHFYI